MTVVRVSAPTMVNCEKRKMWQYLSMPRDTRWFTPDEHSVSHQNCQHNIVDAIHGRHYAKTPTCYEPMLLAAAERWLRRVSRRAGLHPGKLTPWTREHVVATRRPDKQKAFREAAISLDVQGLTQRDARVKMFVKFEKGPETKLFVKSPRLVQYRSTRYTLELARYLAPVEELLYDVEWRDTRLFAKHLNSKQRAEEIVRAGGSGRRYVMLDHSSWDGHVTESMLRREHAYYLWLYNGDPYLAKLLQWQLTNYVSGCGVRFKAKGGRMSGDFNTALGNSILNALVLYAWALGRGLADDVRFRFECDGDDSWMTIPVGDALPAPKEFSRLGFTTKIEGSGLIPEDVEFCQMRPVVLRDGWRMVRNPIRVLSRLPYSIQQLQGARAWRSYARGVAECEVVMGRGVPVFGAMSESMLKQFKHDKAWMPAAEKRKYEYESASALTDCTISDDTRRSFDSAWHISAEEQRAMEKSFVDHSWLSPMTQ